MNTHPGHSPEEALFSARRIVHRKETTETANLCYMLPLALDQPYMISVNINVEDKLVNGASGVLRELI